MPEHIRRPPYDGTDRLPDVNPDRQMHDRESIVHMRAACELAARVLQYAGTMVKVMLHYKEATSSCGKHSNISSYSFLFFFCILLQPNPTFDLFGFS